MRRKYVFYIMFVIMLILQICTIVFVGKEINMVRKEVKVGMSDGEKRQQANDIYGQVMDVVNPHLAEQDSNIANKFEEQDQTIADRLDAQDKKIAQTQDQTPRYTDTSANILGQTQNKGIAIATDNNHWYYWDGTKYVDSGYEYRNTGQNLVVNNATKGSGTDKVVQLHPENNPNDNIYPLLNEEQIPTDMYSSLNGNEYGKINNWLLKNVDGRGGLYNASNYLTTSKIFDFKVGQKITIGEGFLFDLTFYEGGVFSRSKKSLNEYIFVKNESARITLHSIDNANLIGSNYNPNQLYRDCLASLSIWCKPMIEHIEELNTKVSGLLPSDTAKILFAFDWIAYDNRAEMLREYGYKATYTIGGENLSASKISTMKPIIRNLVAEGHDIGLYGGGSGSYGVTGLTGEENELAIYNRIKGGLEELQRLGIYLPTQLGCSIHAISNNITKACQKLGIKYCTGLYELNNSDDWSDPSTVWMGVSGNKVDKTQMYVYTMPGKTFEQIKSTIDTAIQNKYILPLFSHLVLKNPTSIDTSTEIFTQVLQYIKSLEDQGLCEVVTFRELYDKENPKDAQYRENTRNTLAIIDSKD